MSNILQNLSDTTLVGQGLNTQGLGPSNILSGQSPLGNPLSSWQNTFGAQNAPVQSGTNSDQINQQYQNAQGGIGQQQAFVNALQAQNGLGNQSNVFNQLQGVANGTGPNPAQAMLNQQTGANVAQQGALQAGQRGSNANVGLMARNIGQQGANLQQQAVGQGATMQANQSLNAMNQLSGIAGQQVQNQQAGIQGLNNATQNEQNILQGANTSYNSALVGNQSNVNSTNAGVAEGNQKNNPMSGITGAVGAVASLFADGGKVTPHQMPTMSMDEGGPVTGAPQPDSGPQSSVGKWLNSQVDTQGPLPQAPAPVPQDDKKSGLMSMLAKGGPVKALVSPGEQYLKPNDVDKVKQGANPMAVGEKIPGKPKVKGAKNSYANDTVPKTLEEGGLVLPRSVTQAKNPQWAAHKFVMAHMAAGGLVMNPKKKSK
jgi:hypothetical protein